MRPILFVLSCCYLVAGVVGDDSSSINMKVLMSCPSKPPSCRNIKATNDREIITLASGMKVMCDTQTDGGGWIIIQRRINGQISFNRSWEEYRLGFGNYSIGEFYLGNENIYQLTSKRHHELRIDMKFSNGSHNASYSHFRIMGENEKYRMKISGFSGNAASNQTSSNRSGHYFSTYDKDNDMAEDNCAHKYQGGWWYKKCPFSNLNGVLGNISGMGLKIQFTNVTFTEMKIREVEL